MYRKCNYNLVELGNSISNLFNHINKNLPLTKDSTLGEQIKYYHMLEDIKQTDLGIDLNFHSITYPYIH